MRILLIEEFDSSLLVEVGSSGNTLPEALSAVRLFADVLADEMTGM